MGVGVGQILSRIENVMPKLTQSEQKVARFVLESPEEAMIMSVQEMAARSLSSSASVVRFCRSIGLKGFPELKVALSADLAQGQKTGYFDLNKNENTAEIVDKILSNVIQSLKDTVGQLDVAMIEKVAHSLYMAPVIFAYGIGASALVAEDIAQKWLRMGKNVYAFHDIHVLTMSMANAPKGSVFIGISYSAATKEVLELMKFAQKSGLTTVSFTGFGRSELSDISDFNLFTSLAPEAKVRSAATSSKHSQFFVVDVLYYAYASININDSIDKITRTRKATNELKNLPET
ncbi:MurR/RpiR family transcriptional regulator [Paenibacillus riograndensis]|uniref:Phosphosugar-binding transcriptional regulator, RpiR family n=1 Tax=Paenibacillus riograndensis SBR5 TaxID=1073571 RepID=A0A0E3WIN8_9BACL|nr:MurR/RpiR family transcriptional regulator [Paenibacillus riograndensis]CQR57363.1 phosphosugar-binding transcriptional regulator, RpiR family [Paenibacillus riograndensis SBR5]